MDEPAVKPVKPTTHILASASAMIGVSTTLIGLVKVIEARTGPSRVDEFAGLAAGLFLLSAVLSHISARIDRSPSASRAAESVADTLFMVGLFGISAVALFFAYEMI